MNRFMCRLMLCAIAVVASIAILPAYAAPPTLEERLQKLTADLERALEDQHIPGMAIAVVQNDEIIFTRGFGFADLETQRPVTPETIFAIGSTTKAFTSTVIGSLVDEGVMTWDDPVTRWLPYFNPPLDSDVTDDVVTVRDMLSHRTGFTRMSLLFISGEASPDTILRTAVGAEPYAKARTRFLYNNVMYLAAGECAAAAGDSTWRDLVRTRILDPLRMKTTTLSAPEAQQDDRLALGYMWNVDDEEWEHLPMRDIQNVAPAGSINSNVLEMANWVRLQLGRGEFEGKRIVSEESLAETWSPQNPIAPGVDYGFGWMLREWDGRKVVEHGGNIDGFAAEVALLPEENTGFVLLTNTSFAPLQSGSVNLVFEALFGDWGDDADEATAETADADDDLRAYEGVYIANYAQFDNERFTVRMTEEGVLAIDIPSQMEFLLDEPNEQGRRPFKGVPGLAASFDRDEHGNVQTLRLYQGGLQFEVPREGVEYPVEIPLAELRRYLGTYHFAEAGVDVELIIKNNHLAIDVPNQMAFELHPPDDEGVWQVRNNDVLQLAATFEEGEYGKVTAMRFRQGGAEFRLEKVADADTGDLPSLEEVFELCRLDARQAAFDSAGIVEVTGSARFAQSGIEGTFVQVFDARRRSRSDIDVQPFGHIRAAVDGDRGWNDVSFAPFDELSGDSLRVAQNGHPAAVLGDWRLFYDQIRVDRVEEVDGRKVIVLTLQSGDLPETKYRIDADTGDVLRVVTLIEVPGMEGVRLPVVTVQRDFRDVNGVRHAFETVIETEQNGRLIMRADDIRHGVDISDDHFVLSRD